VETAIVETLFLLLVPRGLRHDSKKETCMDELGMY
jgi:hypothetical protein